MYGEQKNKHKNDRKVTIDYAVICGYNADIR